MPFEGKGGPLIIFTGDSHQWIMCLPNNTHACISRFIFLNVTLQRVLGSCDPQVIVTRSHSHRAAHPIAPVLALDSQITIAGLGMWGSYVGEKQGGKIMSSRIVANQVI